MGGPALVLFFVVGFCETVDGRDFGFGPGLAARGNVELVALGYDPHESRLAGFLAGDAWNGRGGHGND